MRSTPWLLAIGLFAACGGGDDGNNPGKDAAADAPVDSICGADLSFAGELVDWDSTQSAFCGVRGAKVKVRGAADPAGGTPPNGRMDQCLPRAATTVLDVTFDPAAKSQCATSKEAYPVNAVLVVFANVVDAQAEFSARQMTQDRQNAMFNQIGQPFDVNKGQLVVHLVGQPASVSITSPHQTTQKWDGAAWSVWTEGQVGIDMFFPNVDPGSVQVTATGVSTPPAFEVEANKFTFVTLHGAAAASGW